MEHPDTTFVWDLSNKKSNCCLAYYLLEKKDIFTLARIQMFMSHFHLKLVRWWVLVSCIDTSLYDLYLHSRPQGCEKANTSAPVHEFWGAWKLSNYQPYVTWWFLPVSISRHRLRGWTFPFCLSVGLCLCLWVKKLSQVFNCKAIV